MLTLSLSFPSDGLFTLDKHIPWTGTSWLLRLASAWIAYATSTAAKLLPEAMW